MPYWVKTPLPRGEHIPPITPAKKKNGLFGRCCCNTYPWQAPKGGAGGGNSWHLACMQVRQLYFDLAVPHNQHGFLVPGSAGADSYNAMHYSAGKGK